MSKGDNPLLESYSPEEMQVLISEAHRGGRKVATHAHSALSIKDAVRAGVDSVEHGIFLDDEGIALDEGARHLSRAHLLSPVLVHGQHGKHASSEVHRRQNQDDLAGGENIYGKRL